MPLSNTSTGESSQQTLPLKAAATAAQIEPLAQPADTIDPCNVRAPKRPFLFRGRTVAETYEARVRERAASRAVTEQEPLSTDEVELINAHGPFNHSVWRGRGVTVTHEEGLAGRVEFLSSRVREAILKEFTEEQLSQMSIVDVGCYDGWLLESLSDLPFARMVGIEPRPENIERGRRVREILRIPSRVEYEAGEINTLPEKGSFDIVLCMGVLHHLEAIASGLRNLRAICRRMVILETLCLSSRHLTPELRQDAELKDVVYRYKPAVFGVTLQKYESSYYPGSGVRLTVVNVPTYESLQIQLDVLGFQSISLLADWETYRQAMPQNRRPISAVCVSARVDSGDAGASKPPEVEWIEDYERRFATRVLPCELIVPLYQVVCDGESEDRLVGEAKIIHEAIKDVPGAHAKLSRILPDSTLCEIVSAFPYAPVDKVRLEFAKQLLLKGEAAKASQELQRITCRTNADWRSCYRAFYLLWRAASIKTDLLSMERFRRYCLTCNPHYPIAMFDAPPAFLP